MGDFELVDETHHGHIAIWLEWRTVVKDDAGADREGGDEPVPHHPGGGGVVEETAFWKEVAVEDVLFLVLEERAKGGVDDAFRWPSGAGGVEDVEWMGWWEVSESERRILVWHAKRG